MRNGGELSDLEYLAMKTEYTKYLHIEDTHTSRLFGPTKQQIRKPAQKYPDNLKCQECGHISSLFGTFKQHYGK